MRDPIPLFSANDLANQLRTRQEKARLAVDSITEEQFLISSDQEIVDFAVSELLVEPLSLREDVITMSQTETQVDVSGDATRTFAPGRAGPFFVSGTRVEVDIPFKGEEWLLKFRTSSWCTSFPFAAINRDSLRISISLPHDVEPEQFKSYYEHELNIIRQYIGWSHSQVTAYNENLPILARQAIASRRERLAKHAHIESLLDIPLAVKEGAPSTTPVRVEIRHPPPLPVPPKTGLVPEPGIAEQTYEHILQFIRHQGRTFETTPATYAIHDEEDLRNIILAQLNGQFKGDAAGELFRGQGKTDICIQQENRSAFVGECKLWTCPASVTGALDQLLGYLTWRDSKASLIIFNSRNKNFSKILEELPSAVRRHPLYLRDLPCDEAGEWRVQTRSEEDEGRRVTVHVFVFNLGSIRELYAFVIDCLERQEVGLWTSGVSRCGFRRRAG